MDKADLERAYRAYIVCLNNRDSATLGEFVHQDVQHNGQALGISGYRGNGTSAVRP
jgi:predicted ester cyclase